MGNEEEEGGGSAAAKTSRGETAAGESKRSAREAAVPCGVLTLFRSSACNRASLGAACLAQSLSVLKASWSGCPARDKHRGQFSAAHCPFSLLCRRCRRRRSASRNAFLPSRIPMTQTASRSFSSCLTIPEWSGDSTSHNP